MNTESTIDNDTGMPNMIWIGSNPNTWVLAWFTNEEAALKWASENGPESRFIAPFKIAGKIEMVDVVVTATYQRKPHTSITES